MKKQPPPDAKKRVYPILRQIVNLIPPNIFHAAESSTKDLSRAFTPWSHAVALICQQLTKTESLNGVCDAARVHASQWQELRGAVPPRRNTFSNANQHRDPAMMETLCWKMMDDLGNLLPSFVIVEDAVLHDSKRALAATANLGDGDTLVADRAYTDFGFLNALALRNVSFIVREKTNLEMETVSELQVFSFRKTLTAILAKNEALLRALGAGGKLDFGDATEA